MEVRVRVGLCVRVPVPVPVRARSMRHDAPRSRVKLRADAPHARPHGAGGVERQAEGPPAPHFEFGWADCGVPMRATAWDPIRRPQTPRRTPASPAPETAGRRGGAPSEGAVAGPCPPHAPVPQVEYNDIVMKIYMPQILELTHRGIDTSNTPKRLSDYLGHISADVLRQLMQARRAVASVCPRLTQIPAPSDPPVSCDGLAARRSQMWNCTGRTGTGLRERGNDISKSTGGDRPGPRKGATIRRNVTQGGGISVAGVFRGEFRFSDRCRNVPSEGFCAIPAISCPVGRRVTVFFRRDVLVRVYCISRSVFTQGRILCIPKNIPPPLFVIPTPLSKPQRA